MANFSATKHAASEFNGGVQYGTGDQFSIEALNASIENGLYAANQVDNKTAITSNGEIVNEIELSALVQAGLEISVGSGIEYNLGKIYADTYYIASNITGAGLNYDGMGRIEVDLNAVAGEIQSLSSNYSYETDQEISLNDNYITNIKAMKDTYILYNGSNWRELSLYRNGSNYTGWGMALDSNFSYPIYRTFTVESTGSSVSFALDNNATGTSKVMVTLNAVKTTET